MTPEELAAAERRLAEIEAQLGAMGSDLPGTDLREARASEQPLTRWLPQDIGDFIQDKSPYDIPTGADVIDAGKTVGAVGAGLAFSPVGALAVGATLPYAAEAEKQAIDYFVGGDDPYLPSNSKLLSMGLESGLNSVGPLVAGAGKTIGAAGQAVVDANAATQAAKTAYRKNPVINQALKAAEGQQRSAASPFGLLTRSAENVDPLGREGKRAIGQVDTALSQPYAAGAATGVAPRMYGPGAAKMTQVADKAEDIYETQLFTAGPELDIYAKGPVAQFKVGQAPQTIDEVVSRISSAKSDVMEARTVAATDLDNALQVLAKESTDPVTAIKGVKYQDFADQFAPLRERAERLLMSTPTRESGQALLQTMKDLESDFARIVSQTNMLKPGYGVISGAQEMGELLPSQINGMIVNLNKARRAAGEFKNSNVAASLMGDPKKLTELDELIAGYAEMSMSLRGELERISKEVIERAATSPAANRNAALIAVSKYDPEFIARMNRTYSALEPMEVSLSQRSRELAQASGQPAVAGLIPAVQSIPTTGREMAFSAMSSAGQKLGFSPSRGSVKQGLLNSAAQDPVEQLKFLAMRHQAGGLPGVPGRVLPKLPRSIKDIRSSMEQAKTTAMLLSAYQLIGSPDEFYSAPEAVQEQMLGALADMNPGLFSQPHGGYRSLMNNRLLSPMDQSLHMEQAYRSGDLKTRADVFDSLNQGGLYRAIEPQGEAVAIPPMVIPTPTANDPYSVLMEPMDMQEGADGVWGMGEETDAETTLQRMERISGAYNSNY